MKNRPGGVQRVLRPAPAGGAQPELLHPGPPGGAGRGHHQPQERGHDGGLPRLPGPPGAGQPVPDLHGGHPAHHPHGPGAGRCLPLPPPPRQPLLPLGRPPSATPCARASRRRPPPRPRPWPRRAGTFWTSSTANWSPPWIRWARGLRREPSSSPQLLMSAEAAKGAFQVLQGYLPAGGEPGRTSDPPGHRPGGHPRHREKYREGPPGELPLPGAGPGQGCAPGDHRGRRPSPEDPSGGPVRPDDHHRPRHGGRPSASCGRRAWRARWWWGRRHHRGLCRQHRGRPLCPPTPWPPSTMPRRFWADDGNPACFRKF